MKLTLVFSFMIHLAIFGITYLLGEHKIANKKIKIDLQYSMNANRNSIKVSQVKKNEIKKGSSLSKKVSKVFHQRNEPVKKFLTILPEKLETELIETNTFDNINNNVITEYEKKNSHIISKDMSEIQSNLLASSKHENSSNMFTDLDFHPDPIYPPDALLNGIEGEVLVEIRTNQYGEVEDLKIKQSTGIVELDTAALDAIKKWKLMPSRTFVIPVEFKINKSDQFE